jgi:exonuclease III
VHQIWLTSTDRPQHNKSGKLQCHNRQVIQKKNQQNKKTTELINTTDQIDLTDIYRVFHPTNAQCTFFSAAHGAISKIDHILGHEASLSKYNKSE